MSSVERAAEWVIGTVRQFVHAPESVQRLPEISLLAGAVLTYVAAKPVLSVAEWITSNPDRFLGPRSQSHAGTLAPSANRATTFD